MVETSELIKRLQGVGALAEEETDLGYIHSGSYALNRIISGKFNGGYPIGKFSEILGKSSTGKTMFATHTMVAAQELGYHVILLDNERAFNKTFAKLLGLDLDNVIVPPPEEIDTLEGCFLQADLISAQLAELDPGTPILILLDSVGTATTREEISEALGLDSSATDKEQEKFQGRSNMAGAKRAKVIGGLLRKFNRHLMNRHICFLLINQIRSKIGVMFGNPETRAGGGMSLEYYCAVSLMVKSNKTSDVLKDNGRVLGINGKIVNIKNKIAVPYGECAFELNYETGLNPYVGIIDKLLEDGEVTQTTKGWYEYNGNKFRASNFPELIKTSEFKDLKEKVIG